MWSILLGAVFEARVYMQLRNIAALLYCCSTPEACCCTAAVCDVFTKGAIPFLTWL